MKIGAQMYTVRDFCKTTEDFAETLAKIADIGYTTVQVSGTCPFDALWLKEELAKNGLTCVLTHTPPARLTEETDKVIAEHDIFGCSRIGLGWYGFKDAQTYDAFLASYKPVAAALQAGGKYFMYHNHAQEFTVLDGKTVLTKLTEDFSPTEMGFTFDTYWAVVGGADPAACLTELAGRIPCIHLKDYAEGGNMAVVGEGTVDFDRVFAAAEAGGTEYMLVEQDHCYGEDPFACLARSYEYLKSKGFN